MGGSSDRPSVHNQRHGPGAPALHCPPGEHRLPVASGLPAPLLGAWACGRVVSWAGLGRVVRAEGGAISAAAALWIPARGVAT